MTTCPYCGKQTANDDNQTSLANQTSLLAHLANRFTNLTETLATEALGYILSQPASASARGALQEMLKSGGVDVGTITRVQTEVKIKVKGKEDAKEEEARVDLVGFGSGDAERLLIEVKFWAGLTQNQPNAYIEEILKNDDPSALLFVAPMSRQETLWPELLRLAGAGGFSLTEAPSADGLMSAAINDGRHRLMLTSWRTMLSEMSRKAGDPTVEKDIQQLQALCDQQDRAAFLPLRAGEIGPGFSKRVTDLHDLYDDVIKRLREQKIAGFQGLGVANSRENRGRFVRLGDNSKGGITDDAWVGVHFEFGAQHRETPFWVMLGYTSGAKTDEIRKRLAAARQRNGLDYIDTDYNKWPVSLVPIHLPAGVEHDHVLDSVAEQIRNIGDILAAPPMTVI